MHPAPLLALLHVTLQKRSAMRQKEPVKRLRARPIMPVAPPVMPLLLLAKPRAQS